MRQRLFIMFAGWLLVSAAIANNTITISTTEGAPDEEVTISICLENTDAVSSLQVSIPLDENLTLVSGSELLADRCGSHSLTVGVKDGMLNVFVYSISMAAISGNSGEVASFKLRLGNQPTTLALTPSKTVLTGSTGQTVEASVESGEVTIRCAKAQYNTMEVDFGAVPIYDIYEQTVTVTNIGNDELIITGLTFSDVNVFSSTTALPLVLAAGESQEMNITYAPVNRGTISRTLKVECNSVSKLNTIKLLAQPFAVNELHVQDASGISDEEVSIRMTMNNMDPISGYQVEFDLPEELEYVANSFTLSDRKQDHQAIVSLNGSVLRILVYSGTDKPLTGNDGEIGSFRVKIVGINKNWNILTPTKVVLSSTINNKVENVVSDVIGGQISIDCPVIYCNKQLDFGAVPLTEDCEQKLMIRNLGRVPLTISRIVFNNEVLSVKEQLPLEIPGWHSADVTVLYSSLEETSFDATMNIYSNDPDHRMFTVNLTGSRFAPNYMSVSTPDVTQTEKLNINIATNTYDDITGLQFDVVYPTAYYTPFDNNVTLAARAAGMTVTSRQIDEQTIRYFCYFLTGGSIAPGDGKLMTIQLQPTVDEVPTDSYTVSVQNIKMGTSNMDDKYAGSDLTSTFAVLEHLIGDVNLDGLIDSGDVMAIYNAMAGNADAAMMQRADVNNDGNVDSGDVMAIYNIMANN